MLFCFSAVLRAHKLEFLYVLRYKTKSIFERIPVGII